MTKPRTCLFGTNFEKQKKNQFNQEIKAAYYNNALNKYASDQRMNWKTINKLTSRRSNKTILPEEKWQEQH